MSGWQGHPSALGRGVRRAGYTVIELALVIALIGLLGAIGAPRLFARNDIDERLFASEVVAALRHARRVAVASGCPVELRFDGADFELAQQVDCAVAAFEQPVPDPADGSADYRRSAPASVSVSSDVDPLRFDAAGRARGAGGDLRDVSISVGSLAVAVVGETGLVRAP